jgi:hypothetical protein
VQRVEEKRIPQLVLYMNLEWTRPRGRPRNRWQDEVGEDGRIVGGEELQEKVYNREERKKLLRTARNCCILHMAMNERMNGSLNCCRNYPPCMYVCMYVCVCVCTCAHAGVHACMHMYLLHHITGTQNRAVRKTCTPMRLDVSWDCHNL